MRIEEVNILDLNTIYTTTTRNKLFWIPMKKYIYIAFLILISNHVNGQFFDKPSYRGATIITHSDTIKCYIENSQYYNGKVKYKLNIDDKKPLKIDALEIDHLTKSIYNFDRIHVGDKSYLMKRLVDGKVCLYKHEYAVRLVSPPSTGYAAGGANSEHEMLYLVQGGKSVKVTKHKYNQTLKVLMSDYPEIFTEIDNLDYKNYKFELNLKKLIRKYNSVKH